jgi:hypothetical protein
VEKNSTVNNKTKKPWLVIVLCFFFGPFGMFYFGWRPGVAGLILFGSVSIFFREWVAKVTSTPPWGLPSLLFVWAYIGWRHAKSWNVQVKSKKLNYFASFDSGVLSTSYLVWLNILISFPVVSAFTLIEAYMNAQFYEGIIFALLWVLGGLLWFLIGRIFLFPWAQKVNYLHFSKKKLSKFSLDPSEEIKSGNNPLVSAIMGFLFNGLGYLYFHWSYAVLSICALVVFYLLVYICGIIGFRFLSENIGFSFVIQPANWFILLFGPVYAWQGYRIAVVRQNLLDSNEATLRQLNSFSFAGMATSSLVVTFGKFYAAIVTIWSAIDFFRHSRILRGVLCLVVALPLAVWLASLIFGLAAYGLFILFHTKYEKNVFLA